MDWTDGNNYEIENGRSRKVLGLEDAPSQYNSGRDFTSLDAWRKARVLKIFLYNEVIPMLPDEEKYNLNVQIRKAAVSGTANIAEGYGRYHYQDAIQFYRVSRASVYELKDHLISCLDLKFISVDIFQKGITLIEDTKVTLNGFINFVMNQKKRT